MYLVCIQFNSIQFQILDISHIVSSRCLYLLGLIRLQVTENPTFLSCTKNGNRVQGSLGRPQSGQEPRLISCCSHILSMWLSTHGSIGLPEIQPSYLCFSRRKERRRPCPLPLRILPGSCIKNFHLNSIGRIQSYDHTYLQRRLETLFQAPWEELKFGSFITKEEWENAFQGTSNRL